MRSVSKPTQNWFFIRGLARQAGHWGELPNEFEKAFPGCKVHCIDLPGNGQYCAVPSPTTVRGLADFVDAEARRILQDQKIDADLLLKPFVLAISLGAMVAVEWVSREPRRYAGLVLINTSAKGKSPFYDRLRPGALIRLLRIFAEPRDLARERQIVALTSHSARLLEKMPFVFSELQRQRPVTRRNVFRQLSSAFKFTPPDKIQLPRLLILRSLNDRIVNPKCALALHKAWGGELETHPWAGHDLALDDGPWIIEKIKDWQA